MENFIVQFGLNTGLGVILYILSFVVNFIAILYIEFHESGVITLSTSIKALLLSAVPVLNWVVSSALIFISLLAIADSDKFDIVLYRRKIK